MPALDQLEQKQRVNAAFSKQALHYDEDDFHNLILQDLRLQVYSQVGRFLQPKSSILELNSGTGIDAMYFASRGHSVHATDLSEGMIEQIKKKIEGNGVGGQVTVQQLSYDQLDKIENRKFDFVFSNFGGLNCCRDLSRVTKNLPRLLKPRGVVCWVIMPSVCLWEMATIIKGNRNAFRRLNKNGVEAQIDGEKFGTWYHSLNAIKKSFGQEFEFLNSVGLAAISPPPHATKFVTSHPTLHRILGRVDKIFRNHFPFNQWADHIIVTFRLRA